MSVKIEKTKGDKKRRRALEAYTNLQRAAALSAALVEAAVQPFGLSASQFGVLETISGETLGLYVAHLLILYPSGIGLVHLVGPVLSLPAAMAVAAVLIITSSALVLGWRARKQRGVTH